MSGGWQRRAFCACGWSVEPPFGDVFHVHRVVCPGCGLPIRDLKLKTVRWISKSIWWKPATWGGRWEERDSGL